MAGRHCAIMQLLTTLNSPFFPREPKNCFYDATIVMFQAVMRYYGALQTLQNLNIWMKVSLDTAKT